MAEDETQWDLFWLSDEAWGSDQASLAVNLAEISRILTRVSVCGPQSSIYKRFNRLRSLDLRSDKRANKRCSSSSWS